jgi:hypothetical protein
MWALLESFKVECTFIINTDNIKFCAFLVYHLDEWMSCQEMKDRFRSLLIYDVNMNVGGNAISSATLNCFSFREVDNHD